MFVYSSYLFVAVTKLVGGGPVEFEQPQYVVEVAENTVADPLLRLTTRPLSHGKCCSSPLPLKPKLILFQLFCVIVLIFAYSTAIEKVNVFALEIILVNGNSA